MSSNNKSINDLKKEIKDAGKLRDTQIHPQSVLEGDEGNEENLADLLAKEDTKTPFSVYLGFGIFCIVIILLLAERYFKDFFYEPPSTTPLILWGGVYPVFVITFLVFLKKSTSVSIQIGKLKGIISTIFAVLVVGILVVQAIPTYLGVFTYYFAVEKIPNQEVIVKGVSCYYSSNLKRVSYLDLTVAATAENNNTVYEIRFPYDLCKEKSNMNRLVGQEITIHGRKGFLGKVYDGFYYSPDLDLN